MIKIISTCINGLDVYPDELSWRRWRVAVMTSMPPHSESAHVPRKRVSVLILSFIIYGELLPNK